MWRGRGSCSVEPKLLIPPYRPQLFRMTVPATEILGDSLPPGRYFFAAEVEIGLTDIRPDPVLLSAGDAVLRR